MKHKEKHVSWEQVMKMTCSLSQEDLESFWDELVILADPRRDSVPAWVVEKALRIARGAETGQGVLEYTAIIGLVAIIIFVIVTWLFGGGSDGGALEQLRSTISQMFP